MTSDLQSRFSSLAIYCLVQRRALASRSRFCLLFLVLGTASSIGCATTPGSTPHKGLSPIASPSNLYTLWPVLEGWTIYRDGHPSHPDADLILMHEESGVVALMYVERGAANSLDDYVARRRTLIMQSSTLVSLDEERRFQSHSEFTPISVSFFRVEYSGIQGWHPVISAVVRGPSAIVEVFVTGGVYPLDMALAEDLLGGLRFSAPRGNDL